tara:strand:- start:202 stop:2658 length:2457 start_codon:yes stop_codon:yes gene_type:complete
MNNNSWFKKQRPFQGFSGFGGGGLGLSFGGGSDPTIEASGGLIGEYTDAPTGDVYRTHTFTSPGKFVVSSVVGAGEIEYLMVGGGGAGGIGNDSSYPVPQTPTNTRIAGGGGGGGVTTNIPGTPRSQSDPRTVTAGLTLNMKIGIGGVIGAFPGKQTPGYNGASSMIKGHPGGWITCYGGGAGRGYVNPSYTQPNSSTRGSAATGGGGSGTYNGTMEPGVDSYPWLPAPQTQGGDGGDSSGTDGGGGGGAAGDSPGNTGGDGIGMTIENGIDTIYYGGGGGGGGNSAVSNSNQGDCGPITSPTAYPAPQIPTTAIYQMTYSGSSINNGGGFGAGGYYNTPLWQPGPPYGQRQSGEKTSNGKRGIDGYGQGGGGGTSGNGYGGQGGSGCIVIRYRIAEQTGTAKATGGIIHYWPESPLSPTGAVIHIFRGPGVFKTGPNFADPTNGHPTGAVGVNYYIVGGGGAGGSANQPQIGGGGGGGGGIYTGTTNQGNDAYGWVQVGQGGQSGGPQRQFNGWGGTDPVAYDFTSANSGCGKDSVFNIGGSAFTAGGGGAGGGAWRVPMNIQSSSPPTGAPQQGGGHPAPLGSGGGSLPWSPTGGTGGPQGNPGSDSDGSMCGGGGGAGSAGSLHPQGGGPTTAGYGSYGGAGVQAPAVFRSPQMATPSSEIGDMDNLFVGGGLGFPGPGGGAHWFAGGGSGANAYGHPRPDGYGTYGGGPGASPAPGDLPYSDPAMNWYGWTGAGASRGPNTTKNIPVPQHGNISPTAQYSPATQGYGSPAACNSGSGGGGCANGDVSWPPASYTNTQGVSGTGGSGIVLIAYPQ